ncbi:MAG: nucleoside hydrolase [Candidatus Sigynarchaeota archaeon]
MPKVAGESTYPIIIDTDIGTDIDDAYALALAIKSDLQIAGISTVSGNTCKRGRIAKKMLVIGGKKDVPVFAGKNSRVLLTYDRWVSESEVLEVAQGVDAMIEHYWHVIEQHQTGRVQIVAIGPLSNIAAVRERDETRFDDRAQLLMMGGSFRWRFMGMKLPEYNIFSDRRAAREIFSSRLPTRIVPLDVTASLKLSKEDLSFLEEQAREDTLLDGLLKMTAMFHSSIIGHRLPILFDPATIIPLFDPSILTFTKMPVEVQRCGFTRVPKRLVHGIPDKDVCTSIDATRFYDLFFTIMTGASQKIAKNMT